MSETTQQEVERVARMLYAAWDRGNSPGCEIPWEEANKNDHRRFRNQAVEMIPVMRDELAAERARAERAEVREFKLHNENMARRARIDQLETNAVFAEMKEAADLRERIEIDERRKTAERERDEAQQMAVDWINTARELRKRGAWLEHWRDFFKSRAFRAIRRCRELETAEKALGPVGT